jgi:hypothetical protein
MSRANKWICLGGGVFLLLLGVKYIVQESDWIPAILAVLIIGFSVSGIIKDRRKN